MLSFSRSGRLLIIQQHDADISRHTAPKHASTSLTMELHFGSVLIFMSLNTLPFLSTYHPICFINNCQSSTV